MNDILNAVFQPAAADAIRSAIDAAIPSSPLGALVAYVVSVLVTIPVSIRERWRAYDGPLLHPGTRAYVLAKEDATGFGTLLALLGPAYLPFRALRWAFYRVRPRLAVVCSRIVYPGDRGRQCAYAPSTSKPPG